MSWSSTDTILDKGNVNYLGIDVVENCNFMTGPNSFEFLNMAFANIGNVLEGNFAREVGNSVYEPTTWP